MPLSHDREAWNHMPWKEHSSCVIVSSSCEVWYQTKSFSPCCFWSPFILLLSDSVLRVAMCQCRSTWRGGAACSATSASTSWTPASTRGTGQRWKMLWVMHLHSSFLTVWKVCSEKQDILDQWKWQRFPSTLLVFWYTCPPFCKLCCMVKLDILGK